MKRKTILRHGGYVVQRGASAEDRQAWLAREAAGELTHLTVSAWNLSDLELIANGALSPLEGFMGRDDYASVVDRMRLANDTVWSVPIVLAVTAAEAERCAEGDDILLLGEDGV